MPTALPLWASARGIGSDQRDQATFPGAVTLANRIGRETLDSRIGFT
jgi:hypothetical protein